jgi:hypothetical protein
MKTIVILLLILVVFYACTLVKYNAKRKVKQVDSVEFYEPMFDPKGR